MHAAERYVFGRAQAYARLADVLDVTPENTRGSNIQSVV